LESDHVIHDDIKKAAKVLVSKYKFQEIRKKLKSNLSVWNTKLDPEDTPPEVSINSYDSMSGETYSFFSNRINSIMAFKTSDIYIPS
jgi:hypothetical protein